MDKPIVIKNGRIFTGRMLIDDGFVVIAGGKIVNVFDKKSWSDLPKTACVVNARGYIVSPGFIDIHNHGGGGAEVGEADMEAISTIARTHNKFGTTSMLLSICPDSMKTMCRQIEAIREYMEKQPSGGARILGIHMEGPFLNPKRAGALNKRFFREPSEDDLLKLVKASGQTIRLMTIAPELKDSVRVIKAAEDWGIKMAVGHSDASYQDTICAINAGVNHTTHAFNAIRGTHHRDPGVMGTVLINDEVSIEIIADNHHVHPAVLTLALMVKGTGKIVLVTDALKIAGLDGKRFSHEGKIVKITDGLAKLPDGTIAGSIITMNKAVKNIFDTKRVPLADALKMASLNPSRVLGINNRKGKLLPDMDADIIILDDNFDIKLSMVEGEITYRKRGF
ncbi:MAG: N-acetylglucosamine-6-phosphate deacetylase [Candidatus Omnitrophota bacterium]